MPDVLAFEIMVLLKTVKEKLQKRDGLYWHDIHTKFNKNPSVSSYVETVRKNRQTDRLTQILIVTINASNIKMFKEEYRNCIRFGVSDVVFL
jgi:hypothetical protein